MWSSERHPDLADDLVIFLGDLCVNWGFCQVVDVDDLLEAHDPLTAEAFARAVLEPGCPDPGKQQWFETIRACFVERYGEAASVRGFLPLPLDPPIT